MDTVTNNSIQHSVPSEATSRPPRYKLRVLKKKRRANYRNDQNPPIVPTVNHINSLYTLVTYLRLTVTPLAIQNIHKRACV